MFRATTTATRLAWTQLKTKQVLYGSTAPRGVALIQSLDLPSLPYSPPTYHAPASTPLPYTSKFNYGSAKYPARYFSNQTTSSNNPESKSTNTSESGLLSSAKTAFSGLFSHGHSHAHGGHSHAHGSHVTWEGSTEGDYEARDAASRAEEMRITKVGFYWNVALTVSKFVAGVLGNSLSLIADAFHSVSDMLSDGVTLLTIKYASAPADKDHPYGHGRIEDVGTLTVSGIVLLTGVGIGWHALEGISQIIFEAPAAISTTSAATSVHVLPEATTAANQLAASTPQNSTSVLSLAKLKEALFSHEGHGHHIGSSAEGPTAVALAVALIAVLSKEYLFRATRAVAQRTQSRIVEINAWHHRSDAASSMVALVGIAGSMMKWPILDPLAALVVGAVITKQGFDMGLDVYHDITDRQMPYELSESIGRAIRHCAPQGVKSFHGLRGRRMGRSLLVDVSIVVPSHFSVSAAHQAAEAVRTAVMATRNGIAECMVHVDVDGDLPHHSLTRGAGYQAGDAVLLEHVEHTYGGNQHHHEPEHNHGHANAASTDLTKSAHSHTHGDAVANAHPVKSTLSTSADDGQSLMRPYYELEADVKSLLLSPEFKGVSQGLRYSTMASPCLEYAALTKAADTAKQLIKQRVKGVDDAHVVLRLV